MGRADGTGACRSQSSQSSGELKLNVEVVPAAAIGHQHSCRGFNGCLLASRERNNSAANIDSEYMNRYLNTVKAPQKMLPIAVQGMEMKHKPNQCSTQDVIHQLHGLMSPERNHICSVGCVAKCKKFKPSSYLAAACPPLVCLLYATGDATGRLLSLSGRSQWENQPT